MPAPKRKRSRSRRDSRRAHKKYVVKQSIRKCPQCSEPSLMHQICKACGYFKGKEVVEISLE